VNRYLPKNPVSGFGCVSPENNILKIISIPGSTMNSELRTQFLHILSKQPNNHHGFTIIELLIVMITIGILSAIALPSVLSQASKAKQVEAKTYTSAMNRAQQLHYVENYSFTNSMDSLGLGLKNQTDHYDYIINLSNNAFATHNAVARESTLKSYAGVAYLEAAIANTSNAIASMLCESNTPQIGTAQTVTSANCPNNYERLNR
jgi:prepilin-type N-terminal cleavage/methylation domain-containing protein